MHFVRFILLRTISSKFISIVKKKLEFSSYAADMFVSSSCSIEDLNMKNNAKASHSPQSIYTFVWRVRGCVGVPFVWRWVGVWGVKVPMTLVPIAHQLNGVVHVPLIRPQDGSTAGSKGGLQKSGLIIHVVAHKLLRLAAHSYFGEHGEIRLD